MNHWRERDELSRVRMVPVLVIAIVTLGILFGAWQGYQQYRLIAPLQAELSKIPGVESVTINRSPSDTVVIQLGPVQTLVNHDLQSTYNEIQNDVIGTLGSGESIILKDKSDQTLTLDYESLQPIIFEGLNHGTYTQMIANVEKAAAKEGIQARVTMDYHNIYIQLQQGSHYLYDFHAYRLGQGGAVQ
ncbi:hypothetical protein FY534_06710 [Alicyclobacillus sp. TC]|nr:hypothetical protein FY534_06710 [Alicyclobacillus sp. TC]